MNGEDLDLGKFTRSRSLRSMEGDACVPQFNWIGNKEGKGEVGYQETFRSFLFWEKLGSLVSAVAVAVVTLCWDHIFVQSSQELNLFYSTELDSIISSIASHQSSIVPLYPELSSWLQALDRG